MPEDSWEHEIFGIFAEAVKNGELKNIGRCEPFFDRLEKEYPVIGSKIDWENTINPIEAYCDDLRIRDSKFIEFFNKIVVEKKLTGNVIYIGDGLTDFALFCSLSKMKEIVPYLVENIPHHHYWISFDFSWCISYTMEGDMAFGYRPPRWGLADTKPYPKSHLQSFAISLSSLSKQRAPSNGARIDQPVLEGVSRS